MSVCWLRAQGRLRSHLYKYMCVSDTNILSTVYYHYSHKKLSKPIICDFGRTLRHKMSYCHYKIACLLANDWGMVIRCFVAKTRSKTWVFMNLWSEKSPLKSFNDWMWAYAVCLFVQSHAHHRKRCQFFSDSLMDALAHHSKEAWYKVRTRKWWFVTKLLNRTFVPNCCVHKAYLPTCPLSPPITFVTEVPSPQQ